MYKIKGSVTRWYQSISEGPLAFRVLGVLALIGGVVILRTSSLTGLGVPFVILGLLAFLLGIAART